MGQARFAPDSAQIADALTCRLTCARPRPRLPVSPMATDEQNGGGHGHRDHRGTYEPCGPQTNLSGPSRFRSPLRRSSWASLLLERVSFRSLRFSRVLQSDSKNSGALESEVTTSVSATN